MHQVYLANLVSKHNVCTDDYDNEDPGHLYEQCFLSLAVPRVEHIDTTDLPVIGTGAYGTVHRYKSMAVKTVSVLSSFDGMYEPEEALKELYILISLASPYIVRLEGYTLSDTVAQILTEEAVCDMSALIYGKGACLQSYVPEVVAAVEYIHSMGVLHRDIKPSNLLLTKDDRVVLCDLGSAVVSLEYTCYSPVGTKQYCDPDILSAKWKRAYTPACDWWSVGCTIAEMVTGARLIQEDMLTEMPLLLAVDNPLSEIEDEETRALVLRCLRA